MGVEFATRTVNLPSGKVVKAQIWDTAGQERYRAITTAYYRGALGALLLFDASNLSSLEHVSRWYKEIKENTQEGEIELVLVANKVDLLDQTQLESMREQAKKMSDELGIPLIETSAKTGQNIEKAFLAVIEKIYEKLQNNPAHSYLQKTKSYSRQGSVTNAASSVGSVTVVPSEHNTSGSGCC